MDVEIDNNSGFCYGVIRAIERAQDALLSGKPLYSLGEIVHNNVELNRLKEKGLIVLNREEFASLTSGRVLIRAHGEPPQTYQIAKEHSLELLECTCPVVLKLQQKIKREYNLISQKGGQIVIFGKRGHAEVNGLIGQVDGNAIIVENESEISQIDFTRPVSLFSQTTQDPVAYGNLCKAVSEEIASYWNDSQHKPHIFNTICGQVSGRRSNMESFARSHSIILFVSGKQSSNGKVLFSLCKEVNSRSYFIESENDIDPAWFKESDFAGICGATSTPKWLMERVADFVKNI